MISILLSTYNGEKYIQAQLDSLLAQTEQDFHLYACDDGSTDNTYAILSEYAKAYPKKITVQKNRSGTGSAREAFLKMMLEHKDDYVFLCDQDDVWKSDKISISMQAIRDMEKRFGERTPLLIHTDLVVVDENLREIGPSYRAMNDVRPQRNTLEKILIQNITVGCTMVYNRALSDLLRPIHGYFYMHDWWIALIASAFGLTGSVKTATVLYRQHGANVSGSKDVHSIFYILKRATGAQALRSEMTYTYRQAETFLDTYSDKLTDKQQTIVRAVAACTSQSKGKRIHTMFRFGTWKAGLKRKIGQVLYG